MKHTNEKNFYARAILIPSMVVATFALYCFNDMTMATTAMAETIENTMETATYVTPVEKDIYAFVPAAKPTQNSFEVADNRF